ncbi:uncharacterized protein LOC132997080 [Limanda limanda]|uniref:uncharacterized protein LOC132997080 n=1 Tax=Limanda limanda TaxID=27771 RepID=UPI0029C64F3F|nr:uncharacterized protein LOC132997080 [Limanda limanda]
MKVCYTLICCFFLYDVSEGITYYSANEGGNITVKYPFRSSGSRKLCRGPCEAGDVLIETEGHEAESGRYSIKYEKTGDAEGDLTVTFTQVSKSDSGTYQFGLGSDSSSYREFGIIVIDAQLDGSSEVKQLYKRSGGDVNVQCFFTNPKGSQYFCREECGETKNVLVKTSGGEERSGRYSILYLRQHEGEGGYLHVTITQLISSDSGSYRCSMGEESHIDFKVIVTDAQLDGRSEGNQLYTRSGGDVTVECFFPNPKGSKYFCREECGETKNVLVKTSGGEARSGRYSIKYLPQNKGEGGSLFVTITQLISSDSGSYRCSMGEESHRDFKVIVADARLDGRSEGNQLYKRSGGDVTVECFFPNPKGSKYFCREECGETKNVLFKTSGGEARSGRYSIKYLPQNKGDGGSLFVTITQLISSDSGSYRCSMGEESHRDFKVIVTDDSTTTSPSSSSSFTRSSASPETTDQSEDQTPETTGADTSFSTKNLILTVGLTLVVMVILLSGAALMFCRNRTNRPREPPVETDPASVPEPDPENNDIGDEGRPPAAVEISPDYSYVKYSTTQPVTAGDDDNFVTAATSQHNADDSSASLTYAQVNISNRATGSANSAPPGEEDVVYSVLQ